jgi:hypothetical protein
MGMRVRVVGEVLMRMLGGMERMLLLLLRGRGEVARMRGSLLLWRRVRSSIAGLLLLRGVGRRRRRKSLVLLLLLLMLVMVMSRGRGRGRSLLLGMRKIRGHSGSRAVDETADIDRSPKRGGR